MKQVAIERDDLARNFGSLQSALRNAEADFRAAQRTIESFERHRREDREQIRDLHKRIEEMIGEIARLKTKAAGGPQQKTVAWRWILASKQRVIERQSFDYDEVVRIILKAFSERIAAR